MEKRNAPLMSALSDTAHPPKLLDQVVARLRVKHYSLRTEKTYVHWIKRYIWFHGKRHPQEMGAHEIEAFLSHLAVEHTVSASTQNQAKSALLFFKSMGSTIEFAYDIRQMKAQKSMGSSSIDKRAVFKWCGFGTLRILSP